jgi:hypothetical protein
MNLKNAWFRTFLGIVIARNVKIFCGYDMMKEICSYLYTKLAGIELEHEPSPESEEVAGAMDYIGDFRRLDSILGPAPINFETLKASPHTYIKTIWTMLSQVEASLA